MGRPIAKSDGVRGTDVGEVTPPIAVFAQVFILRGLRGVFCGSVDFARDRRDLAWIAWVGVGAGTAALVRARGIKNPERRVFGLTSGQAGAQHAAPLQRRAEFGRAGAGSWRLLGVGGRELWV
jgi:hypothetical protein